MSDLLSLLSLGSNAISAQSSGIAVATNNVANVNTEGYSRERVDLESLLGPPTLGGVRSGSPSRIASDLLATRIRNSAGSLAESQTRSDGLADIEATLTSGPAISDQLAAMFAKLNQVAAAPTDKNLRQAAVTSISNVVAAIRAQAGAVADATTRSDKQIGDLATQANTIATQLATANKAVMTGNDPTAADRRDVLAKQLAQIVGGSARIDGDGQMRFVLDGGAVLVDGNTAAAITAAPDPTTKLMSISVGTRDVTQQIGGGKLAGELGVRTQLTQLAGQYDQYAYDLATGFNSVSAANAGLDGVSGRTMFVAPTGVAGAAAALAVDPGLVANSDQLATAAVGAGPGDNTGALALYGLATAKVASGGTRTLTDASVDIVGGLGGQVAAAKSDVTTAQAVDDQLGTLRDSISGVDLTEETANLSRFQNATQALTQFVSTINTMLSDMIDKL